MLLKNRAAAATRVAPGTRQGLPIQRRSTPTLYASSRGVSRPQIFLRRRQATQQITKMGLRGWILTPITSFLAYALSAARGSLASEGSGANQSVSASESTSTMNWTVGKVFLSIFLFIVAALLEVGGGWLVWQTVRNNRAWYYCLAGCLVLVGYGFVPCAQPLDDFGRIYAIYGGFFILLSFAWGWLVDGFKPDTGDLVGSAIALAGVLVIMLWKR